MEKNGVIENKKTKTKNHLCLLNERFFNIWYLMRYGRRDDKQPVIWLVKFLEGWCSTGELKKRIVHYVEMLRSGKLDEDSVQFFRQAYAAIHDMDLQSRLLLK